MILNHLPGGTKRIHRLFEPCCFSGNWKTEAKLPSGPVADFNVIFDAKKSQADVHILKAGTGDLHLALQADYHFFHVFGGEVEARTEVLFTPSILLKAEESLMLSKKKLGPILSRIDFQFKDSNTLVAAVDIFLI